VTRYVSRTDPLADVRGWFDPASAALEGRPEAALATVDAQARPSARWITVVRLDHGIVFFTGNHTREAADLAVSPHAVVCLRTAPGDRRARIGCAVELLTDFDSDRYFDTLDRPAQLGVWTAPDVADSSGAPTPLLAEIRDCFAGQLVPRPRRWGGYRLVPTSVELGAG